MNRFYSKYKHVLLFIVLLCGVLFRFALLRYPENYDMESFRLVAKIFMEGKNVYLETPRYNYGPIWYLVVGCVGYVSHYFSSPQIFRLLIVFILTSADIYLAWTLYIFRGRISALIYWFNPLVIYTSGYHGQFDNIAIALGVASVLCLQSGKTIRSSVLLGFSLITKHTLFLFPLWLALRRDIKPLQRLLCLTIPYGLFAVSFVPFVLTSGGREGVIHHVFLYKSFSIAPFHTYVLPLFIGNIFNPSSLFVLGIFVIGLVFRRKSFLASLSYYLITLILLSPAFADQYFTIPSFAMAYFAHPMLLPYSISALWVIINSHLGLLPIAEPSRRYDFPILMLFLFYFRLQLVDYFKFLVKKFAY